MGEAPQSLFTREGEHERWVPGKFSEVIVEFAQPLLYVEPDGPPDIKALRNVISVATVCWNAPMWEVQGDRSPMQQLQPTLMTAPPPIAAAMRKMLASRLTRYAGVPHTIIAEVTGSSLEDARVVARAHDAPRTRTERVGVSTPSGAPQPIEPTTILPLAHLFPQLAEQEQEVWHVPEQAPAGGLPAGTYILRERFCADLGCDCRRVMLYVEHVEGGRVIATVGYSFDPPAPPYDRFERQIELDWLNPQSEHAEVALRRFEQQMARDPEYRARLMRHYVQWKRVVEDRTHPLHAKLKPVRVRTRPAYPRVAKVGANAACPCGSGRKYKRCCRS
jgi:hypothetical protein